MKNRRSHPSKEIKGTDGAELDGKRIVLCVTSSVAAYRAIDLSRLLMRRGADVYAVMSEAAGQMVTPEMMRWATGNDVVTRLTGELEHIDLADYGASDLVIVYPCTANTIGKAANGIDDTPVTSVLSVAIGSRIPVIVAPAMHEAMYENVAIAKNVDTLKGIGITFLGPVMSEGKAKVVEPERVVQAAIDAFKSRSLFGRQVLVTAGNTVEFIDPIRVITNLSSGKMGNAIAKEAIRLGAEVTMIYGHGSESPTSKTIQTATSQKMFEAVTSELKSKQYDLLIMAAAVSDFAPEHEARTKIDTRAGTQTVKLVPTKKIVDEVKKLSHETFLVAFKADYGIPKAKLIEKAFEKLQECDADLVVANDLANQAPGSDLGEFYVVDGKRNINEIQLDSKDAVARKLMEIIVKAMENRS